MRDACIEPGGQDVDENQHADGRLGRGVDAGGDEGQVDRQQQARGPHPHQLPAQQDAQNDGADGQALDPAIGPHQLRGGQQFGQDAVLGG